MPLLLQHQSPFRRAMPGCWASSGAEPTCAVGMVLIQTVFMEAFRASGYLLLAAGATEAHLAHSDSGRHTGVPLTRGDASQTPVDALDPVVLLVPYRLPLSDKGSAFQLLRVDPSCSIAQCAVLPVVMGSAHNPQG